ncbi:thiol reductant ABC exporter subunit CydD [Enemella evansiae]|uniref:Thiol reductant ABC exporter subunit CydD n=1 Tax=Enemella evansiae TaxID=2016499 RepID=A0A255GA65_9ACTN|nr:thiol reductant ABC exporter subunit CydD [Enemella evansiae]OYO11115.1 thiol reductant ABC exporter subunit CydD [Enemella evansiae]OYO12817.1 thiol reductant ABC exporter subunit CydD [Enemella evansiae]OYO19186.1 thiol reductant ABC exporter subunit CydD [Enemella evansiae]TDO91685.1 ATP-binding cassette subfamily C protein CydD [Enemella evansiae]
MAGPIDPRLLTRARATRGFLIASVVVGSATALLVVAQAWLLSRIVARVFDAGAQPSAAEAARLPFGGLAAALGMLALVIAGRAVLAWFGSWLAHRSAAAVKSQLRADIIDARLAAPGATRVPTGQLVALLGQGLDALDGYYARYLPQLVLALTVPLIVGVTILTADLTSTIVVALTLPLIPLFMVLIGLATKVKLDRSWRTQTRLANHFADLVAGLPTLQVFGRAKAQEKGLVLTEQKHRSETMSTLRVSFLSSFALELLATYSVALVAVPIGLRLVEGNIDLTTGLFVLILVPECYLPVRQVGVHYHDSIDGITAADEAFAIIEGADAVRGRERGAAPDPAAVEVQLAGIGVRHPGAETDALTDFSLAVRPGEVVALSGPSGSGKSTALAVLMGFLTPTTGRVLVGDTDLATIDPAAWRARLAYVAQQPGVINASLAENVRLGDPAADDAAVAEALRRAGAGELDPARAVGDDGVELSAGELRRVAVARALLRLDAGAGLLVLDEPTAGLDAAAEQAVIEAVRRSGASALVVSHRDAVLAAADRVVRLTTAQPDEVRR